MKYSKYSMTLWRHYFCWNHADVSKIFLFFVIPIIFDILIVGSSLSPQIEDNKEYYSENKKWMPLHWYFLHTSALFGTKKWRWRRHVTSRSHIKSDFHKIFRNHLDSYNYDTVKIWSQLYKIYRNYYNFSFCQFVLKCIIWPTSDKKSISQKIFVKIIWNFHRICPTKFGSHISKDFLHGRHLALQILWFLKRGECFRWRVHWLNM